MGLILDHRTMAISGSVDLGPDSTAADRAREERDVALSVQIGAVVEAEYPSNPFRIQVDSEGGIVSIYHPLLPPKWGYHIRMSELNSDPTWKLVKKGAGELLERYELPRGRYRRDLFREASQKHRFTKHGIFPIEVNWVTGERRYVMPAELT